MTREDNIGASEIEAHDGIDLDDMLSGEKNITWQNIPEKSKVILSKFNSFDGSYAIVTGKLDNCRRNSLKLFKF